MYRYAMREILAWKESPTKKPLLIRGARQVGKTWLMKEFGSQNYQQTIYANLDLNTNSTTGKRLHAIFDNDLDPYRIVAALEIAFETKIDPDTTLIIFDEIQEHPRALNSLKYFAENAPEYHLVCAGSQLGLATHNEISFPVGKVSLLYMYPLSFSEFLRAVGRDQLADLIMSADWDMIAAFHDELVELLRYYYCVGGMPEVVADYANEKRLTNTRELQRSLLEFYRADFSKHAPVNLIARIRQVWDSIPVHLARENKKLVWGTVRKGARAKDFELALQWLFDYGLAYSVERISKPGMPLRSYAEQNIFKLFMLDVGLLGAMAGLDISSVLDENKVFTEFKGALTEQYALQQLLSTSEGGYYGNRPYYWTGKAAEIDFVMQFGSNITPIEVKSAENLQAQSLKSYIDKYRPKLAIRSSLSPYRKEERFTNIPLYGLETLE
ncbi:ATPase [Actinomycetota bacterium]|nr:ATPase [Actinomycetota bacterium]